MGSPPDCHRGAGGLIFQLGSGNPRAAAPHPAPCVPRSPPPPRGLRLHQPPRPPGSTGFQGEGRQQRGQLGRDHRTARSVLSSKSWSSPQPPGRWFPKGLTINPSPGGPASPVLLLGETRGPLVTNSGGSVSRKQREAY